MKILLAGDSWGIGVFQGVAESYGPTGEGIKTILEDLSDDYQVINVSKAGGSNEEILERIRPFSKDVEKIIFIQTDPFREHSHYENRYKILHKDFIDSLVKDYSTLEEFFDHYYNKIYSELNNIGKPILCVGGWSKLHPSIEKYKNLIPAIPSATQTIISELEEDVYLSDFEWFPQLDAHTGFYRKFKNELRPIALASSRKFELLCQRCGDCHPDLDGYKTLVDCLLPYLK